MVDKRFPMTSAGKEKLKQELTELKMVKQKEVLERIKTARTFCDFSEDSEFRSAIEQQASVEDRIVELEKMIQNAELIELDAGQSTTINLGHTVTIIEVPNGPEETYTIVGRVEADSLEGKISNESPMAKNLIGHQINDEITIETPGGKIDIKIMKIS